MLWKKTMDNSMNESQLVRKYARYLQQFLPDHPGEIVQPSYLINETVESFLKEEQIKAINEAPAQRRLVLSCAQCSSRFTPSLSPKRKLLASGVIKTYRCPRSKLCLSCRRSARVKTQCKSTRFHVRLSLSPYKCK